MKIKHYVILSLISIYAHSVSAGTNYFYNTYIFYKNSGIDLEIDDVDFGELYNAPSDDERIVDALNLLQGRIDGLTPENLREIDEVGLLVSILYCVETDMDIITSFVKQTGQMPDICFRIAQNPSFLDSRLREEWASTLMEFEENYSSSKGDFNPQVFILLSHLSNQNGVSEFLIRAPFEKQFFLKYGEKYVSEDINKYFPKGFFGGYQDLYQWYINEVIITAGLESLFQEELTNVKAQLEPWCRASGERGQERKGK